MRYLGLRAVAGLLLLAGLAACGPAPQADQQPTKPGITQPGHAAPVRAALSITLMSLTSPVAPSRDASLQIRTSPGANCAITVLYKSGPSRAQGLYPQTADAEGRIAWSWRVGSNTTSGRWPIVIACEKEGDQRELKTSFEVR